MTTIPLTCSCGRLEGKLESVDPGKGERFVCLCDDCQAYIRYLGQEKMALDPQGGTEIFAVTPSQIKFTKGLENLSCLKLSEKGMLRWYASCCKTPIGNTPTNPAMPYAGLLRVSMKDQGNPEALNKALGPIRARVLGRFGKPPFAENTYPGMPLFIMLRIGKFMLRSWVKGLRRPTPFFKEGSNEPTVPPCVLTAAERGKLYRPA